MDLPADGDLVYVPARPVRDGIEREPAVELRRLRDSDERVGLAFTSPQALVETLGECQPWISMPMYSYVAWLRMQGVYRVQVDPRYDDDVSQWSADRLADAMEVVS
jgi:hypothetical protein